MVSNQVAERVELPVALIAGISVNFCPFEQCWQDRNHVRTIAPPATCCTAVNRLNHLMIAGRTNSLALNRRGLVIRHSLFPVQPEKTQHLTDGLFEIVDNLFIFHGMHRQVQRAGVRGPE